MSRVHYAFDEKAARDARLAGKKLRISVQARLRNRSYMRSAMQAAGLFAFGFGSTSLVMHLAAGFFLISRATALFPAFHI